MELNNTCKQSDIFRQSGIFRQSVGVSFTEFEIVATGIQPNDTDVRKWLNSVRSQIFEQ